MGPGNESAMGTVAGRGARADAVFAALADPTRRRILADLRAAGETAQRNGAGDGERTLTEIAVPHAMTLSAVSQHLRVLRNAELVTVRQSGRERRYRLHADPLRDANEWIRAYEPFWNERLGNLSAYLDKEEKNQNNGG